MKSDKKKVYVCSPLSAATQEQIDENMRYAQQLMQEVSRELDCTAVAPHAYLPYLLDDTKIEERQLALNFGVQLLGLCEALVIGSPRISAGMENEIRVAKERNMPIYARVDADKYYSVCKFPSINTTEHWAEWEDQVVNRLILESWS